MFILKLPWNLALRTNRHMHDSRQNFENRDQIPIVPFLLPSAGRASGAHRSRAGVTVN